MPFNPTNTRSSAVPVSSAATEGIDPRSFKYAIVTDARGTNLLAIGEVYPIASYVKKGFKQGVGDDTINLRFANPVVQILGATRDGDKPAMPYFWDVRRFNLVEFDELTPDQKTEALERF